MGAGGWAQQYARGWRQELEGLDPGAPAAGGGVGPAGPLFRPRALLWAKPRGQQALLPEHPVFTLSALFGQACLSLCLTPGLLRDPLLSTSAFTTSLGPAFSRLPSLPQPCGRAALRPRAVHKPLTSLPAAHSPPPPGDPGPRLALSRPCLPARAIRAGPPPSQEGAARTPSRERR